MTEKSAQAALAGAAGILPTYRDLTGTDHPTGAETAQALLAAQGLEAGTDTAAARTLADLQARTAARTLPEWLVVPVGTAPRLTPRRPGAWQLRLEDGTGHEGRATGGALTLPPLPLGIHDLTLDGDTCTLLAAPPRLPLPPRGWGVTLPLYGLRDADTGGLADYADLRMAVEGLGGLGAGFVGINPIHAGFPRDPDALSPYTPSSRRWFSTAHIAGGDEVPARAGRLVDPAPAIAARLAGLRAAFDRLDRTDRAALASFRTEQGAGLERFALHQALSDRFGPYWHDWPAALHDPAGAEARAFAAAHPDALAFHAWLQMRAAGQLAAVGDAAQRAGMAQGLYLDLAVGTHPAGAETWAEPDLFARSASLGAPPDAFAPQGQNWALAPMVPGALVARGFRPLAEVLRAQLRCAGMLRIDHILGFARAFWVPEGAFAGAPGAYVTMPSAALLAVARIEAARSGAVIVGEDLGVIPDGLRADLDASGILGCRLLMFEPDTATWPEAVLASFGTHDLPPFVGWKAGGDIGWHARLGHIDAASAQRLQAVRADEASDLRQRAGGSGLAAMHALLAASPARLVAVQIEDALGRKSQANLPGTITAHPNWRRRIGPPPSALARHPALRRAAAIMARAGR